MSTLALKKHTVGMYYALASWELPTWVTGNAMRIGVMVCAVFFFSAYIFETVFGAANGFELSKVEQNVAALNTEQQQLAVEIAEASALAQVRNRIQTTELVAAPVAIRHFSVSGVEAVAKR